MNPLSIQRYQELEADETKLRRLTGFKHLDFESLHLLFKEKWQGYFAQFTLDGSSRVRQASIRKNSIFPDTKDALLFGLIYLNGKVSQEQLANFFGVDQPKASKYLRLIQQMLHQILEGNPRTIPKKKQKQLLNVLP